MLKLHSFLQRIKNFLCKVLPNGKEKYKIYMAMMTYTMVTVLILISPNYIYGTESNKVQGLENIQSPEPVFSDVKEETDNEAVIRVKQTNPEIKFILYDFRTQKTSTGNEEYLTSKLVAENKAKTTSGDNLSTEPEKQNVSQESLEDVVKEDITEKEKEIIDDDRDDTANSNTDRADAKSKVDNSSTKEKEKETLASVKYVIDLKKADIEILQRIVEAEATGEDVKGKMLVANVILNRVKDEKFPDTVKEVVFQKSGNTYQFSPIKDNRYWTVKISEDTITAVDRVMQGEDSSEGALYFSARSRADKNSMKWFDNNLKYLFQYGGHEFFKNK